MPIIRGLYPKEWRIISTQVKWAAKWICEECGKECRQPGEPFDSHERTLTCAHINHKPWECDRENLKALCAPCHLRHDASHNQKKRWFQVKIDGGLGVGRQLHMFVQGIGLAGIVGGPAEDNAAKTEEEKIHGDQGKKSEPAAHCTQQGQERPRSATRQEIHDENGADLEDIG